MNPSRIIFTSVICICAAGAIVYAILGQERAISVQVLPTETQTVPKGPFVDEVVVDTHQAATTTPLEVDPLAELATSSYETITE